MAYICLKHIVCNMQLVNDTEECAVQYVHMNRGPRDLNDVILVATGCLYGIKIVVT